MEVILLKRRVLRKVGSRLDVRLHMRQLRGRVRNCLSDVVLPQRDFGHEVMVFAPRWELPEETCCLLEPKRALCAHAAGLS